MPRPCAANGQPISTQDLGFSLALSFCYSCSSEGRQGGGLSVAQDPGALALGLSEPLGRDRKLAVPREKTHQDDVGLWREGDIIDDHMGT